MIVSLLPACIKSHIGTVQTCRLLSCSSWKEVFHISSETGEYVLKVSGLQGISKIHNESYVLNQFQIRGTSFVPSIITESMLTEGGCCLLNTFIPGDSLSLKLTASRRSNHFDLVQQSAILIRKVHDFSIDDCSDLVTLDSLLDTAEVNMKQGHLDPEEFLDLEPRQMLRWLDDNRPKEYRPILTHGDFRPKNIIMGCNGITSLIDWEHSIQCSPYYDLSMFYYYLTTAERKAFASAYGVGSLDPDQMMYYDRLSKFLNV